MMPLRVLLARITALFQRRRLDTALNEEIRAHLDRAEEEHRARGLSPQAAREAAQREFGGVEQMKEAYRDQRGLRIFSEIGQDIRHGLRVFRKAPTLTLAIVLTLAIGVCATATVFTLINVVLLKTLPVADPERLVLFSVSAVGREDYSFSYPLFQRFRDQSNTLTGISAQGGPMRLRFAAGSQAPAELIGAQPVSGNFFSMLGVTAAVGRTMTESDDADGHPSAVVVLSDRYWTRRFGRDPAVIGSRVTLDDTPFTVIGVAPVGFHGYQVGSAPDLWWPIQMLPIVQPPMKTRMQPGNSWLLVMGRLASAATKEQAQAELEPVFQNFRQDRLRSRPTPLSVAAQREFLSTRLQLKEGRTGWTWLRPSFSQPLLVLMGLVSTLLLMACVNIMNLLLSRNAVRQAELAMRTALGATRGRLVRQLLTECALLALAGGGVGFIASQWASRSLLSYLTVQPGALDVAPDAQVYGFTLGITILTAMIFGIVPTLRAANADLTPALHRSRHGRRLALGLSLSDALVVVQVALSVLLVSGAVLFGRTLQNLNGVETGFARDGLTLFALDVPSGYDLERRMTLYRQLRDALASTPGIRSASFSAFGLLGGSGWSEALDISGYTPPPGDIAASQALLVGPGFVETIGTPVLYGTDLPPDRAQVALINETMARRFFPGGHAIGGTFRIRGWAGEPFEIVGVVADTKYRTLREQTDSIFYVPFASRPQLFSDVIFEVRTEGAASGMPNVIERVVRETDPRALATDVKSVSDLLGNSVLQEQLVANVAAALAVVALILASIGLYGVRAQAVTRRISEIGVRLALGARRRDVFWMIHRRSTVLLGVGLAIGIPLSVASSRTLESLLFGIEPADPLAIAGTALILSAVGTLAGLLPARRATKVDPATALRCE